MRETVLEICGFIKALWTRATAFITGGTVAAIIAVHFALGGTVPVWLVLSLVMAAFYSASFIAWRDEHRKLKRAEEGLKQQRDHVIFDCADAIRKGASVIRALQVSGAVELKHDDDIQAICRSSGRFESGMRVL